MKPIRCEECGESRPDYDIVNCGSLDQGYRQLCCRCFNAEVAERIGQEGFENFRFAPVQMVDHAGQRHEFHFRTRLLGNVVALDAFEVRDGRAAGYQFQMIGDPDDDLMVLLGRLIERMRRQLSVRHLRDGDHGPSPLTETDPFALTETDPGSAQLLGRGGYG